MTTVRDALQRCSLYGAAEQQCRALGIDPDLDLDTHRLVAALKCQTCGGNGYPPYEMVYPDWDGLPVDCPACRGTGDAGVPVMVILPPCPRCLGRGNESDYEGEVVACSACKGWRSQCRSVVLPAEIAEKLWEMLDVALVHGWRMYGGKPWPKTTDDVLAAWLGANS